MRLLVPFGPRPEIVKLAPVVAALRHGGHDVPGVATRQHHDPRLADRFFAELGLDPAERWLLPRNEPARVGTLLGRAYETIDEQHPARCCSSGMPRRCPWWRWRPGATRCRSCTSRPVRGRSTSGRSRR